MYPRGLPPGPPAERFAEIVKLRNKLARVAGYQNYYAMKLEQAEGFGMDVRRGGGGGAAGEGQSGRCYQAWHVR